MFFHNLLALGRFLIAMTLVAAAILLNSGPMEIWQGLGLWFAFAIAIGSILNRWWALLLAFIPWPIGIQIAFMTRRIAFLGEQWEVGALLITMTGILGISIGVLTRRAWRRKRRLRG